MSLLNHVPNFATIEARNVMQKIKERALATQEPGHQIVAFVSGEVRAAVAV